MASKKQQVQIGVPNTGVRGDVNSLVQTSEMAAEGTNCIYFDGTIRPRPALDVQVENYTSINTYQPTLDGDTWFAALGLSGDASVTAMVQEDEGGYILCALASEDWVVSRDNGQSWAISSLDWPTTGERVEHVSIQGNYIYAFTYEFDAGAYCRCYRCPIATLPDSGSWTKIGEFFTPIATVEAYWSYNYDSENDAWVTFFVQQDILGQPWVSALMATAWVVYDASTATPTTDTISDSIDVGEFGYTTRESSPILWVDNTFLVYPMRVGQSVDAGRRAHVLVRDRFEWTGSEYELTRDGLADHIRLWELPNVSRVPYNPLEIINVEADADYVGTFSGFQAAADDLITFVYSAINDSDASSQCIASIEYDDDGLIEASVKRVIDTGSTKAAALKGSARTTEKIVYGILIGPYTKLPVLFVSSDNGAEFMKIEPPELEVFSASSYMYFNDVTDQHFFFYKEQGLGPDYEPFVWLLPTSLGSSSLGSITTVYQVDLDDEDDALVIGTTSGVARLNTETNAWDLITANQLQTVPGDPAADWDTAGDIPPLSVDPSEDNYVSGVSIEGTYGVNQWVFRAFEAQGKTFLIGTNGQCYPIIYHPDMEEGFARRLGEVPGSGDPNYIAGSPGELAPRAKCIATGANRVILANNPTGSPFEVNVGAFNDPDRGWSGSDGQLVLLGDTPGEIITMNEISALQVAIYKEDAIYHAVAQATFLDVNAPFRFELSKAGVSGPCSPASVQRNFDGRHIYLARDGGVYMYDGVAPLDGGRNIRRMIQNNIDLGNIGKAWGMVDSQRKLVWFFYPGRNQQVNRGIVISTDQGFPWPAWPVKLPQGWNFAAGSQISLNSDTAISELTEFDGYGDESLGSFSSGQTAMLMGRETGVFFTQKWDDDGSYTDSGEPIDIHLRTGWTTPGQVEIFTADELYHIFSSPDPEQQLEVRLRAQQIGQNIKVRGPSMLSAGKVRRRTRHRVSGTQFAVDIQGKIGRMFNWGGAVMTIQKRGNRG